MSSGKITELIKGCYFDENDRVEELVQESHSSSDEEEENTNFESQSKDY